MASLITSPFVALALFLLAYTLHYRLTLQRRSKSCPLPPSPNVPYRPFVGLSQEMMDDSLGKPWAKFRKWRQDLPDAAQQTGLLHIPTIRQTNIVIAKASLASELLEKRGANYAGRLPSPFTTDMVNHDMILANSSDPKRVKRLRRLLHEQFSQVGSTVFQDMQRGEAALLLDSLLQTPTSSDACYTDSKHRLVLAFTYGNTSTTLPPSQLWDYVKHTERRPLPAIAPLFTPFPWLRFWPSWLPGGGFHQVARDYHDQDKAIWEQVRGDVKRSLDSGLISSDSCLLARMYASNAPERLGFSDLEMAFVAANLFIAGGDLPEITMRIFTLAMLHWPEAMKKAQAEIDAVVGRERLPDFEDKNALSYTRALILETQRWRPLSGIGVSHTNFADDWIDGFFIPKGSVVFPDLHAMSMDESVYPQPELFRPERFLNPDGTVNRKNELATFGYGHRMCSARFFGEATVFLNIACVLWAFNIEAPVDAKGQAILPNSDMDSWDGINPCQPPAFEAIFKPRHADVLQVVASGKEAVAAAVAA